MKTQPLKILAVSVLLIATVPLLGQDVAAPPRHSAVTPLPQTWMARHLSMNEAAKKGDIDLVFIGDSITQGWEGGGKEVWQKFYGDRKALNLGISGDRTQNVLWRLDNGNLDGIHPKLAVIMIGTNNSNGNDNTAEEIADGIKAVVDRVRLKSPDTKVLLLAIFPRGEKPTKQREKNATASELASSAADGQNVIYLDIGEKFLGEEDVLSREIMRDLLHLTPKGYEIWAEAVEPKVAELLGDTPHGPSQSP